MLKEKNNKKVNATAAAMTTTLLAVLLALLSNTTSVGAQIPSPHGISGYIYDLDGITQAPAGTGFSITNLANGQVVQGRTGKPGNTGKYSASTSGNDGDLIILRAWNAEHNASRNFTLSGVMRGVNLLLNLTLSRLPPEITSTPITAATEDSAYSYDVEASDYNIDETLTYSMAQAPQGMSINPLTGMVMWTPVNSQVGSHTVTAEVSDGNFTTSQTFTLLVENVNDAPAITSAPLTTAVEDSSYLYSVIATDEDGDSLTYLLTTAPPGMAISSATGAISWVPAQANVGASSVTVTVSDGNGGTAAQPFTILVENVNDAPQIISAAVTEATQGAPYYYDVQAADEDGDALSYWLVQKPSGMTINASSGAARWMPNNSQVGLNSIIIRVTDSLLITDQAFAINVSNVNDLPIITSEPVTAATQDVPYGYDVEAYDPDNDAIIYALAAAPQSMAINPVTGAIRWVPTKWQTGAQNATAAASDQNGTTTQTFTIVVENVNDQPAITSMPITTATEDEPYTYDANATDPDGDALFYSLKQAPPGMLIDASSGLILWHPDNSHVGNNSIVLEASDSNLTVNQSFTITVANTNDAPTIVTTPPMNATANELYVYDANATDPDGDAVNYSLTEVPEKAEKRMKIDNATGVITWTPRASSKGNNSVTVQASDGSITANQSFVILVSKGKEEEKESPGKHIIGGASSGRGSRGSRGSGGGEAAGAAESPLQRQPKTLVIENKEAPVGELKIVFKTPVKDAAVEVSLLPQRPQGVKSIEKRVYSYLKIEQLNFDNNDMQEAGISFRVGKDWLRKNNIEAQNIALNRYTATGWGELPTATMLDDNEFAYYEAKTPGFSLFAISVKSEAELDKINSELPISLEPASAIKQAYPLYGVILQPNSEKQVDYGTMFSVQNMNGNDSLNGTTGIGQASGMFFAVISGRTGDTLSFHVEAQEGGYATMNLTLTGQLEGVVLVADFKKHKLSVLKTKASNSLDGIKGLAVIDRMMLSKPAKLFGYALLTIAALAAITAAAKLRRQPKPLKQPMQQKTRKKERKMKIR